MSDSSDGGPFRPKDPGTYTIVGGRFNLEFDGGVDPTDIMDCRPQGAPVVDTLQAIDAATPTTTPVRPVIVQTDFAEEDAGVPPLLVVGALVALLSGAAGLARRRHRPSARRH